MCRPYNNHFKFSCNQLYALTYRQSLPLCQQLNRSAVLALWCHISSTTCTRILHGIMFYKRYTLCLLINHVFQNASFCIYEAFGSRTDLI